jgi:ABC-type sugar transport system permease subunit
MQRPASALGRTDAVTATRQSRRARRIAPVVVAVAVALLIGTAVRAADANWSAGTDAIVYGVAASADGSVVVAGRRDNAVAAYDAGGALRWTFATQGTVYDVAVSDDGQRIVAGSEDRTVYLLDGAGQELWRYSGQQTFTTVAITPDGAIVAAGSEDRRVTVLARDGAELWQYTAGDDVTEVAVYGGEAAFRVVAGTRDSRVSLFSGRGDQLWESRLDFAIRGLSVTPNGAKIVAGDDAGNVVLLDGASGRPLWTESMGDSADGVAIARDGTFVVAASRNGELRVLGENGDELQREETGGALNDLALTGDGTGVVLASDGGVAFHVRDEDGRFDVEQPASRLWRYAVAAIAVVAIVAVVLGLRRRASGERAWRGYARDGRRFGRQVWRSRVSYLFLLPTLALLLTFNYYPAFSGIYHAFTVWSPGIETRWVGLRQFRSLADDRYFWTGIGNLVILVLTGFAKLIVPLVVAELIFHLRSGRLRYLMRTLFVLQIIVPGVVGILLWVNIYDPNIGLANQLLRAVGLDSLTRVWLGDVDTALSAIVFIGFPWANAFALLIFYGGLISIPSELFDAAEVDGAGALRRIFNIHLPLLLGQVRLLVILTFIITVQEFAAIFLTTGGGPGSATYVPSLELYYQAVRFNNFGLAAAIGAVLFVVILLGTILNLRFVKSSVEYST